MPSETDAAAHSDNFFFIITRNKKGNSQKSGLNVFAFREVVLKLYLLQKPKVFPCANAPVEDVERGWLHVGGDNNNMQQVAGKRVCSVPRHRGNHPH